MYTSGCYAFLLETALGMPFTMICDRIAKNWPLELSVAASPGISIVSGWSGWMIGWLDAWKLNLVESSVEIHRITLMTPLLWSQKWCVTSRTFLVGQVGCWNNIQIVQATELMYLSIKSSNLQKSLHIQLIWAFNRLPSGFFFVHLNC